MARRTNVTDVTNRIVGGVETEPNVSCPPRIAISSKFGSEWPCVNGLVVDC